LPEQVVLDVIQSAFSSAGQRCSVLRVLFIQDDIAERIISDLQGALQELSVGDPSLLSTDVGPLIEATALSALETDRTLMCSRHILVGEKTLSEPCQNDSFFAPCIFEIPCVSVLTEEVFGPILHIVRYKWEDLSSVLEKVEATGYGLT
jgi:RHH-type transcriptional regulator, proline utilization regulon repressor / proline dehydrogenase / delta 1-pyrroline-5-carboxylate dehydrogenase